MKFDATYYDGLHPVGKQVTVLVSSNGTTKVIGPEVLYTCNWPDIVISNQLGNTPRSLQFPNNAKCETSAHKQINSLESQFSQSGFNRYLALMPLS